MTTSKTQDPMVENLNAFIEKIDGMKKQNKLDLSSDQDLTIAIMNLISLEEHCFFSGAKTETTSFYDMLQEIREMRKELLLKIVKDPKGEVWCISKHLLAASMRLMEVGTKQLGMNNKEEAYDFFQKAFDLYSLFWGLNLEIIDTKGLTKISEEDQALAPRKKKGKMMTKLGVLVKKAIDCCLE
jgi:hypothetical protein